MDIITLESHMLISTVSHALSFMSTAMKICMFSIVLPHIRDAIAHAHFVDVKGWGFIVNVHIADERGGACSNCSLCAFV